MYRRAAGVAAGAVRVIVTLVGAVALGLAIPIAWLWIGAAIQGSQGGRAFNPVVLAIVLGGMLTTYLFVAQVGARLGFGASGGQPRSPTHSWNRSMRDQPNAGDSPLTPLERLFAGAAVVVSFAYAVWWVTSAGSGLPPPGGP